MNPIVSSSDCDHFYARGEFQLSGDRGRDHRWYLEDHPAECEYLGKDFRIPMLTVLREALKGFPLISIDPDVLGGTPRLAGTRIPVSMVLDAVQFYGTIDGAIESYPDLIPDQIREALSFASVVLEQSVELEFTNSVR
jgi:uncharacterized protein (DUF433 family)